ncbi:MAG: hypothetical protein ACYCPW_07555 [Nitrososphaerales archaeon]
MARRSRRSVYKSLKRLVRRGKIAKCKGGFLRAPRISPPIQLRYLPITPTFKGIALYPVIEGVSNMSQLRQLRKAAGKWSSKTVVYRLKWRG